MNRKQGTFNSHTNINLKSVKTTMSGYETEMYDALCNLCSVGILGVSVAYLMPKTYFVQVCDFTRQNTLKYADIS